MSNGDRKAALVTGGSHGGIGHATALAFARLGYHVAITGRDAARLDQALADMRAAAGAQAAGAGQKLVKLVADFGDEKQVDGVVPAVLAEFGRLDILVNNAGFVGQGKGLLEEGFFDDYRAIMQVNLLAPTRLAQLAAPHLLKAPAGGVIVNVSSVVERMPVKNGSYAISKAGLNMLTKALANAFEGKSVRVLTVSPGPIMTNLIRGYHGAGAGKFSTLAQRSGTSDEVANVIEFLCSDKASYMTGSTVEVDGGWLCKAGLAISEATYRGVAHDKAQEQ